MKKPSTPQRTLKITKAIRDAYERRDKTQDFADTENPVLPPEMWENAVIGKYYRPLKTQISFRVDNDVLDWLKSKGEGHLTRINAILREEMCREKRWPPHASGLRRGRRSSTV
jgi:uncharacterized protein (DUF4415 family)